MDEPGSSEAINGTWVRSRFKFQLWEGPDSETAVPGITAGQWSRLGIESGMCTRVGEGGSVFAVGGQVEGSIVHCTKAFPKIFVLGSIFSSVQGRDAFLWLVTQTKIRRGMRKEKRALQVLWWGPDNSQRKPNES